MRARRGLSSPDMMQALYSVKSVLKAHTVGQGPLAFLELLDGRLGICAIIAVCFPTRKAENVEASLQLAYIGPVEVGKAQIQRSISHVIAFVDECRPSGCINVLTER